MKKTVEVIQNGDHLILIVTGQGQMRLTFKQGKELAMEIARKIAARSKT